MRRFKSLIALMLTFVMVFMNDASIQMLASEKMPGEENNVSTENEVSGTCGEKLTWTLTDGTLVVSGNGEMYNYHYDAPWYEYRDEIEYIKIEDGVESIGAYAFYACTSLKGVEFSDTIEEIGNNAFANVEVECTLDLPNSLKVIGDSAFYYAGFKGDLVIPSDVEYIGEFAFCGAIECESGYYPSKLIMEEFPEIICKNAFGYSGIIVPCSMRVGNSFQCWISAVGLEIPNNYVKEWNSSNDNIVQIDETGMITATSEGEVTISAKLYDGSSISRDILIQKKDVEIDKGDVVWYIPERIKIGYKVSDPKVGNSSVIASLNNIPEEYYGHCAMISITDYRLFSYPPMAAFELSDRIMTTDSFYAVSGPGIYYAMAPGKAIFQATICDLLESENYDFGEPYTVIIEEPIIEDNAPDKVVVGDTITLQSMLTNTDLTDESILEYKERIEELKNDECYCVVDYPVFEPEFIIESGSEIVEFSEQDFTHSLSASEKMTFKDSGKVRITIRYNYLETCRDLNFNIRNLTYVPEKTIEIIVEEKATIPFTVQHYVMDVNGEYELALTEALSWDSSTKPYYLYNDFVKAEYNDGQVLSFSQMMTEGYPVNMFYPNEDGTSVIQMYYDRRMTPVYISVNIDDAGGGYIYSDAYYIGSQVNMSSEWIKELTRNGFGITGNLEIKSVAVTQGNVDVVFKNGAYSFITPINMGMVVIEFTLYERIDYEVDHYVMNESGDYVLMQVEHLRGYAKDSYPCRDLIKSEYNTGDTYFKTLTVNDSEFAGLDINTSIRLTNDAVVKIYYDRNDSLKGWKHDGYGWKYQKSDGSYVTNCWYMIDGQWYAFNEYSYMREGWFLDGDSWYYLTYGNGTMHKGWLQEGGSWYYFAASGEMLTGWIQDGGAWYYMNGSGAMMTGWVQDGGTWYYMNGSGAMATGWVQDGGSWYYMNGSGAMMTGWVQDGGTWYYMHGSGVMATGWVYDGGEWYYMNPSGAMATGWILDGGNWYYLYDNGVMARNTWIGDCYVDDSGVWIP